MFRKYIPYIIIVVLGVCLLISLTNRKGVSGQYTHHDTIKFTRHDTIEVTRVDTFERFVPHFDTEKIVDAFYVEKDDSTQLKLPKTQRIYQDTTFKAWVSGFEPNLDSIKVFQSTRYITIENTTVKEIYPKKLQMYGNIGAFVIQKDIAPYIGVKVKFKNDFMLGGNVGYYDKDIFYGVEFSKKF